MKILRVFDGGSSAVIEMTADEFHDASGKWLDDKDVKESGTVEVLELFRLLDYMKSIPGHLDYIKNALDRMKDGKP